MTQPLPLFDLAMAGALSGLTVALALAIIWGAVCYWVREITEYWRWVRLSRRARR